MSDTEDVNFPSQKELEREISEYLSNKYGKKVRIISAGQFPMAGQAPAGDEEHAGQPAAVPPDFHFDLAPEELIAHLDQYVVGQEEAKAILATKICTHFNRISRSLSRPGGEAGSGRNVGRIKNNVLLIGPTGVGKTYLIKLIAQHIGVPFVKGDATKFSETGYVGGDVEDLIRDLVREADNDLERARFGIVYLDEVDKIAGGVDRRGLDVSRSGVQRALLKPMEETEVEMKVPHDPIAMMEAVEHYRLTGKRQRKSINTRHILFIMSGAFSGLDEIIGRRLQQRSIGFENTVAAAAPARPGALMARARAEDLVEYGFESEFIGRLPVLAVLSELSEDDLYEILSSPNSAVVVGKKQDFRAYGIELRFEDAALRKLAALAARESTGARALVSVMERVLLHFEKKLPSTDIRQLVVTPELVADPAGELAKLLKDSRVRKRHSKKCEKLAAAEQERLMTFIRERLGDYLENHDVLPTPERLRMMAMEVEAEDLEPAEVCERFIDLVALVNDRARQVSRDCGLELSFSEEAVDRLLARMPRSEETVGEACDQVLQAMEYGLRLLSQRRRAPELVIPADGVDAPDSFINQVVNKTFKLE
ncbi:AAA family ATPase [Desulfurivibrio alkaliphilus]|uniref:ATPase AAA-2 domain protein n=1 Tax=Desulfurivibrio alkaliphilus (strain DSM 19089 / UNIQEM U267 / AHT2) TaxID=589865 RepID=D6Z6U2_DESAT|nr:AAA family ATPase [Desulfurivibrio alkaliphilus]ADH85051.1 ATPase AAA-2 domain protein [Desulfurivibrio alkaliphilus AHT 2]